MQRELQINSHKVGNGLNQGGRKLFTLNTGILAYLVIE